MAATGNEAVTLAQLKTAIENSGSGGSNVHVFELTASTPSFTFEKSGIVFERRSNDFTIVAVDSEYGVCVLGVFQHSSTSEDTVGVLGGDNNTSVCYTINSKGDIDSIRYDRGNLRLPQLALNTYITISMWIPKA